MTNAIVDRLFTLPTHQECEKLVGQLDYFFLEAFQKSAPENSETVFVKEKFSAPEKLELDLKKINPLDVLTPYLEALKPFLVKRLSQSPSLRHLTRLKNKVKVIFPGVNESTLMQSIELLKTPAVYLALSLKIMLNGQPNLKDDLEKIVELLRQVPDSYPEHIIGKFADMYEKCKNANEKMLVKGFLRDFVHRCLGEEGRIYYRDSINHFMMRNVHRKLLLASCRISYKNKRKFEKKTAAYINEIPRIKNIQEWFLWFEKEDELVNKFLLSHKTPEINFKRFISAQRKEIVCWLSGQIDEGQSYVLDPKSEDNQSYTKHAVDYCARGLKKWLGAEKIQHEKQQKKLFYRTKLFFNRRIMGRLSDPVQREIDFTNNIIQAAARLEHTGNLTELLFLFQSIMPALKNRKRREFYKKETFTTVYLEKTIKKLSVVFPDHVEVRKIQNNLFNDGLCFSMENYLHQRKTKPFFQGVSFHAAGLRDYLFDAVKAGGKKTKKAQGKTHDGLSHRESAVEKLVAKINSCCTIEEYLSYCAMCLRELDSIYDNKSRLKRIVLQQINKILTDKIIPLGDVVQKVKAFEMLYCKKIKHPLHEANLKLLTSCLKQDSAVDLDILKKSIDALQEEHPLINHYLKKGNVAQDNAQHLKTPARIEKNPALKQFHDLVLTRFSNELLAFKVAATGKFSLMPEALTSAGYFAPLSLAKLAQHITLPVATLASNSFTAVAQGVRFADQCRQRGKYQDISEVLTTSAKCDEVAKAVAANLTKTWEYQITKLYEGDRENVNVFAHCAVTRMVDYLVSQEYLRYGHLPLDLQFCFAVRSHRLRHGMSGTRLVTRDCTSTFSDKAWVVEEIFEKTPIQLKDGKICCSTAALDKYGAAKDGEEIASLLCWAPTQETSQNEDYRRYKHSLRTYPRFDSIVPTETEVLKAELAKAENTIVALQKENAKLTAKNENHEARIQKLESCMEKVFMLNAANQSNVEPASNSSSVRNFVK